MINSILEAIKQGKHTYKEIEDYVGIRTSYLSVMLDRLIDNAVIRETKEGYYINERD